MHRKSIPTFSRILIVTLCQKGFSSREVPRRLRVNQSDVVRTWRRYRDTGTVDNMRPHLTSRHHAARYRWAQQHAEWTRQNWHQFLCTEECHICLQPDNRRRRIWRQCDQAELLRYTVQRVQLGGGSLMFWGGFMWCRRTPLEVMKGAETAIRYRSDII